MTEAEGLKVISVLSENPSQIYVEVQDTATEIHVEIEETQPQFYVEIERTGPQGAPGIPGESGEVWLPIVDTAGELTWTKDDGQTQPDPANIKGPEGVVDYSHIKEITTYTHEQAQALDTWQIEHNLGYYPSVSVTTYGGTTIIGAVKYIDINNLTVEFTVEVAGYAHLS